VLVPRSSSRDQFEQRTPFDVLDDPAGRRSKYLSVLTESVESTTGAPSES
jgi:hypothetical protein